MSESEHSSQDEASEWTWREIEQIIHDLKVDGYEPVNLESSASDAVPEKTFTLEVER